ncbi:MAG: hypothetical protein LBG90_06395 [Spirochaetaceae bacterium]|nr:hypothetical protein [Spirochaetaceae bacterium]
MEIIFSAGSLILCAVFFLYFKAYLRRRTGPDRLLAEFREEVYKLIAEIDTATDKDALLVEERIKTLRGILEEADKRIGVLLREMDRKQFQEETYSELGRKRQVLGGAQKKAVPGVVPFPDPLPPEEPTESAGPHIVIPEKQIEPKALPIREQILDLSRAGLDSRLIALRLGLSIAEVETAIAISSAQV